MCACCEGGGEELLAKLCYFFQSPNERFYLMSEQYIFILKTHFNFLKLLMKPKECNFENLMSEQYI